MIHKAALALSCTLALVLLVVGLTVPLDSELLSWAEERRSGPRFLAGISGDPTAIYHRWLGISWEDGSRGSGTIVVNAFSLPKAISFGWVRYLNGVGAYWELSCSLWFLGIGFAAYPSAIVVCRPFRRRRRRRRGL